MLRKSARPTTRSSAMRQNCPQPTSGAPGESRGLFGDISHVVDDTTTNMTQSNNHSPFGSLSGCCHLLQSAVWLNASGFRAGGRSAGASWTGRRSDAARRGGLDAARARRTAARLLPADRDQRTAGSRDFAGRQRSIHRTDARAGESRHVDRSGLSIASHPNSAARRAGSVSDDRSDRPPLSAARSRTAVSGSGRIDARRSRARLARKLSSLA